MCCSLFNTGAYHRLVPADLKGGKPGDPDIREELTNLAPLEGVLSHIHYVRDWVDSREAIEKKKKPTATKNLYSRFLFFKNFVVSNEAVVVPEGKTDPIYLKAAIESLTAYQPRLGSIKNGKLKSAIRFIKPSPTVHNILQLGSGAGDIKHFIQQYAGRLKQYRHRPLLHPVIVLIDNDDGAKDIFSVARTLGAKGISTASTDSFYRLADNLYLVKTPESGKIAESCIEDLFDPILLKTEISGKKFDPKKQHGEDGKYGKVIFAEKVIRPQKNKIDFSKFSSLLDRIVAVLDDYAAYPPTR